MVLRRNKPPYSRKKSRASRANYHVLLQNITAAFQMTNPKLWATRTKRTAFPIKTTRISTIAISRRRPASGSRSSSFASAIFAANVHASSSLNCFVEAFESRSVSLFFACSSCRFFGECDLSPPKIQNIFFIHP